MARSKSQRKKRASAQGMANPTKLNEGGREYDRLVQVVIETPKGSRNDKAAKKKMLIRMSARVMLPLRAFEK